MIRKKYVSILNMYSFIYFFVSLGEKQKSCKNFMNQIIRWNWKKKSSEDWLADRTQIKWPHCTRNSWHQLARSIQRAGHAVDNLFTTTLLYIKLCALNLVKLDKNKTKKTKQICSAEDCLKNPFSLMWFLLLLLSLLLL